jgi:hypothetical protein
MDLPGIENGKKYLDGDVDSSSWWLWYPDGIFKRKSSETRWQSKSLG